MLASLKWKHCSYSKPTAHLWRWALSLQCCSKQFSFRDLAEVAMIAPLGPNLCSKGTCRGGERAKLPFLLRLREIHKTEPLWLTCAVWQEK